MSCSESLSAEDNLFGRVALYNKLVAPEQVAECTQALFVEAAAGPTRRSLGDLMVERGYMSTQVAKAIAEAVQNKLGHAPRVAGTAIPARPQQTPASASNPPSTRPRNARAGDSQVLVRAEPGLGPKGARIELESPEHGDSATLRVACAYLYPTDARELAAACQRLLEADRPNMVIDMRSVDYVPSLILGEIAKAGAEVAERGRKISLLVKPKVAAVAEMIIGRLVTVVAG